MLICDKCEHRGECYAEGRLITYTTALDMKYDIKYGGKNAHGILGIGQTCPRISEGADDDNST